MASPRLKKAFGQHHLVDASLCAPLVAFLQPAGRRVLEIGPGGGVLTRELAAAGARLWAWEVDPEWAFALASGWRGGGAPPPALVVGDALEIPWDRMPAPTLVAGNLPYNVATPIVRAVVSRPERIVRAAFLVQKEVGDRLAAGPGESAYGALSVVVAARARVTLLGRVKAGSFRPPPKVDGAFVGLEPRPPSAAGPVAPDDLAAFDRTVFLAFGQRRKTLANSLGAGWGKAAARAALAAAGIDPGARAEALSVADFAALTAVRPRS